MDYDARRQHRYRRVGGARQAGTQSLRVPQLRNAISARANTARRRVGRHVADMAAMAAMATDPSAKKCRCRARRQLSETVPLAAGVHGCARDVADFHRVPGKWTSVKPAERTSTCRGSPGPLLWAALVVF
eukprot:COSAG01_NODE_525_length_15926_cov_28.158021_15_plen_130_part_00